MAVHETYAYMLGGKATDGKPITDLWRFDFENVSPKGTDLHGVVAERLCDQVPFTDAACMLATADQLICLASDKVWFFDFKQWTSVDCPLPVKVLCFDSKFAMGPSSQGGLLMLSSQGQEYVDGNFLCS